MEPTRANSPEDELPLDPVDMITRLMFLGLLEHVELIERHPYEVVLIDKWGDNIFAVYHKVPVFRVLQIPRRCHETFSRFCMRLKENKIQNCYLEYVGRADKEPVLKVYGGGFHVYMS